MNETRWLEGTELSELLECPGTNVRDRKWRLFALACCRRVCPLVAVNFRHVVAGLGGQVPVGMTAEELQACCLRAIELVEQCADHDGPWWEGWQGDDDFLDATLARFRKAHDWLLERDPLPSLGQQTPRYFALTRVFAAVESVLAQPGQGWTWKAAEIAESCAGAAHYHAHPDHDLLFYEDGRVGSVTSPDEDAAQADLLREIVGNPYRSIAVDPDWLTADVIALAHTAAKERNLPAGTLDSARLAILSDALEDAGCTDAAILNHCRQPGEHVLGCWLLDLVLDQPLKGPA